MQAVSYTVDQRQRRKRGNQQQGCVNPGRRKQTTGDADRQYAKDEGTITFAHGAIVASGSADHGAEDACVFADQREYHDQHDGGRPDACHQREGKIERAVGCDVAEFIEIGAKPGLLPELPGQHPVYGVERHAQRHPHRNQQKDPQRFRQ